MTTPEVEEPVDETADTQRLHNARTGLFSYVLLTDTDRSALRMERAHDLEADLYRIELALEESTDNAERENLGRRADLLLRRLRVHLTVLSGAIREPDGERRTACSRDQS